MALGDGRRRTLKALEEKPTLAPIDAPASIEELREAIAAVSVDGYMTPDEGILDRVNAVYGKLLEDAKPHYVKDRVLLRRINAMRRQFNTWKGRKIREQEMPGPMEAGPANYPTKKLRTRQRSERNAYEELQEKKRKVYSAIKGARQRALQAVGSSVAEQNEKQHQSKREKHREQLSKGDIVQFRNPDLRVGRIVRVNTKSVTVEYKRGYTKDPLTGEELDPLAQGRVDLDSKFLTLLDAEMLKEAQEQIDEGEA